MTHRSDDHTFENTIDEQILDMHQRIPRGNQPSARVWAQIREEGGIPDSTSDVSSQAISSANSGKRRRKPIAKVSPGEKGHLGWTTWVAAALVVVLIGASARFLVPEDNGQQSSEHSVALAPGTPDLSEFSPIQVATPIASPNANIPIYGPEYACHAEPLTSDQVLDIVMNPHREYMRLGYPYSIAETEELNDAGADFYYWRSWFLNPVEFSATTKPEETQSIVETGNEFWNCLMTGTAFQVWALMHPYTVQHEILTQYPVLRDEETLRRHIEEWGPRKYSASIYHAFPDLGNVEPIRASMIVDETPGNILVRYNTAEGMPIGIGEPFETIIRVIPVDPSRSSSDYHSYYELLLHRAPDGRWWVTAIYYPG